MTGALLDSNILIDLFNGIPAAAAEWGRYDRPAISVVTWIEVMAGIAPDDDARFRNFLRDLEWIELTPKSPSALPSYGANGGSSCPTLSSRRAPKYAG